MRKLQEREIRVRMSSIGTDVSETGMTTIFSRTSLTKMSRNIDERRNQCLPKRESHRLSPVGCGMIYLARKVR